MLGWREGGREEPRPRHADWRESDTTTSSPPSVRQGVSPSTQVRCSRRTRFDDAWKMHTIIVIIITLVVEPSEALFSDHSLIEYIYKHNLHSEETRPSSYTIIIQHERVH